MAAPRAWTLEWGYRRLILARFVALIWASGCAVAIAILVAATDSTITSGMAARNTLMIASLTIALSRSIGPDPATLVPMGIFGLLLLAGKHNDNTVAGWAVVLHPDLSIPAIIVLLAFLLAATAAECAPPSQPKDE